MTSVILFGSLALAIVFTSGCAMPFVRPGNYINATWDGFPRLSEDQRPFPFRGLNKLEMTAYLTDIDAHLNRLASCIGAYLETAPSSETPRIVIFLHGGLNGLANGLARTKEFNSRRTSRPRGQDPLDRRSANQEQCDGEEEMELQREKDAWARRGPHRTIPMADDKFARLSKAHWIFLNWDSGFGSSFAEDACCIRLGDRKWTYYLDILILLFSKALDTIGQLPYTFRAFANNAQVRGFDTSTHHNPVICPLEFEGRDTQSHPWDLVTFVPQAFWAQGVKFVGMGGWDSMKRRAELVMDPGYDRDLSILYFGLGDDHSAEHRGLGGAGYHLFHMIRNSTRLSDGPSPNVVWRFANGREREVELILVAHSMGTIVANQVLSKYPKLIFKRIIYLGAAASIRSVEQDVYPYLRLNPQSAFWSFMLHPADEARDRYGFGSALRWLDIYLERVGTSKGMTFGSSINVRYHVAVPADVRRQVSIVEVNAPDRPRDHQSLGDWPFIDTALENALKENSCWDRRR